MAAPNDYPWTYHFIWKLLHNDPGTLSLLAENPFPDAPPKQIRALLFRYTYAPLNEGTSAWWHREQIGYWLRPTSKEDLNLRGLMEAAGWSGRSLTR
jgi:hypothetical protein